MSTVKLLIHGKPYEVSCDDGQELHLRDLAEQLSATVGRYATEFRSAGKLNISLDYLLVLTSLTLLDELYDIKTGKKLPPQAAGEALMDAGSRRSERLEMENAMAETLDKISEKLEALAAEI